MEILRNLVARVGRAFYEPKYMAVLDALSKNETVIDDKLAVYLKLPIREVHKICGKLKEDRLIKVMTKKESRRPE
ncbi:hypothetical protein K7432_015009, partial [Basidiobolus ranarum]